jgi:tRNA1Val (adenine37-N6)-methyltransferase
VANNYFRFKQFTVQQQHCTMKVCTDACIFGAFGAAWITSREQAGANILDIGSGTGVLSLMLAQQSKGQIDAVELDEPAYQQAKQNIERSPWAERLHIFNTNVLAFQPGKKYDFIISNPPFFEGDLKSRNIKKNAAKHNTTLTLEQLLPVISDNLLDSGSFAVLLPYHRTGYFMEITVKTGYFLIEQLLVRHTERHPFFRSILIFSRVKSESSYGELSIKNDKGSYTPDFTRLLSGYYLHL